MIVRSSIEALALAVTIRMIRGGTTLSDVIDLAQFLNHFTLKIPPLIAMDPLGHPKPHNHSFTSTRATVVAY